MTCAITCRQTWPRLEHMEGQPKGYPHLLSKRDIPGFVWDIHLVIWYLVWIRGISHPISVIGYPIGYHIVTVGISPIYIWDIPSHIPHCISMRISHTHRHMNVTGPVLYVFHRIFPTISYAASLYMCCGYHIWHPISHIRILYRISYRISLLQNYLGICLEISSKTWDIHHVGDIIQDILQDIPKKTGIS